MKYVCIFCASSARTPSAYIDEARELTRELHSRGFGVVYGGGSVGLMGAVADEALKLEMPIIGVIPSFMVEVEWAHPEVKDMRQTQTMSERKQMMIALSDAIVALPGSTGTFDELFEAMSDKKLGLHGKPIVMLNTRGFFDPTIEQLRRMVSENFMTQKHMDTVSVAATAAEVARLCDELDNKITPLREAAVE